MATLNFLGGKFNGALDDSGKALDGGKLYFYEPGTTTLKDTYTTSALTIENANPVILNSAGRAAIWLNGNYKVKVDNSADTTIYTEDEINPAISTLSGNYNVVLNGSFEDDTDADGTPDSWDLFSYSGSTNARVTTDQDHGQASMKFISTGTGGGYITSTDFFAANQGVDFEVLFSLKSSVVDVRNLVTIFWYKADKSASATASTDIFDESAANPTSWTSNKFRVAVPSDAYFAKLRLYGCHSSDATSGTTWYDDVIVRTKVLTFTKGADIASAATITPGTDGNYYDITGTVTVTAIAAVEVGTLIKLHFDGALTLTHHATNLILPGGANITTAAGDEAELYEYGSGTWRCTFYTKATSPPDAFVPTGTGPLPYVGTSAPTGWLLCDGSESSCTTYSALFLVIVSNIADWGRGTKVGDFTADSGTDIFTLGTHGLSDGDLVHVANSGGALPSGLSTATVYYIISSLTNTFQLSTTSGGSAVNITDNGSGTNSVYDNFLVPDLRGRVPLGADNMGSSSANRVTATQADNLGQSSGAETHTLTTAELASHTHTITSKVDNGLSGSNNAASSNSTTSGTPTTNSAGSGNAHNNMQPYQTFNYIIKT